MGPPFVRTPGVVDPGATLGQIVSPFLQQVHVKAQLKK